MTVTTPAGSLTSAEKAWEEKMARLAARKPLQRVVTFDDAELVEIAHNAQVQAGIAESAARAKSNEKHKDLKNEREKLALAEKAIPKDPLVRERRKLLEQAETARDEAQIKITLRQLNPHVYEALQAQHPANEEQRKKRQAYNVDRFAPALIAASCTEPMTPQQAAFLIGGEYEVLDDDGAGTGEWERTEGHLSFGEASLLYTTAVGVNEGQQARLGKE